MTESHPGVDSPTAVLVCADAVVRDRLARLLASAGLHVGTFDSAGAALAALAAGYAPDLVVTEMGLPDLDGWRLGRLLRSPDYPACHRAPVLIVSAAFSGSGTALLVSDLDSASRVPLAFDEAEFVARVQARRRGEALAPPPRALVVSADAPLAERLLTALAGSGYAAAGAASAMAAAAALADGDFDLLVLDATLPGDGAGIVLDGYRDRHPDGLCILLLADAPTGATQAWLQRGATVCLAPTNAADHLVLVGPLAQLFDQLRRGHDRADGVEPEPRHGVRHRGNDVLRAVGDAVGHLQHFARQARIAAYELRQAIGPRHAARKTKNFLARFLQGW